MRPRIDTRNGGYVWLLNAVIWAALAIDRLFFHIDRRLGWFTAALAVGTAALGLWRICERRS